MASAESASTAFFCHISINSMVALATLKVKFIQSFNQSYFKQSSSTIINNHQQSSTIINNHQQSPTIITHLGPTRVVVASTRCFRPTCGCPRRTRLCAKKDWSRLSLSSPRPVARVGKTTRGWSRSGWFPNSAPRVWRPAPPCITKKKVNTSTKTVTIVRWVGASEWSV